MLRQLRSADRLKRVLWFGLLIIIIPSFIAFYGTGSGDLGVADRRNQTLVTIEYPDGGESEITPAKLRMAKNYLEGRIGQYAQMQGELLQPQDITQLVSEKAVIDQAINLDIIRHYAEVNGITVSQQEIIAQLQEGTTAEQRRQIQQNLEMQGRDLDSIIEEERQNRVLQKAMSSIGSKARVTHYEAWQDYAKSHEKIVANYYRVNASDFLSSVTVTDEGLSTYFKENEETFRVPDQVQYEYALVRKDDLKSSVTLSDDEITSYYANNTEEFRLPRKVEARQIFLKLPSPEELNTTSAEALTSLTEAVTARANDIYERVAKGENFAALADQLNEEENLPPMAEEATTATDNATTAGGYLGLISEDVAKTWYGEQWTSSVFTMQPGSITRPIRTANGGIAVVQVDRIIEGEIQPLDQVRPIVETKLRDLKVEPLFEQAGQRLTQLAETVTSLQQLADATSATVRTSPKVNRGEKFVQGIGLLGDFEEAVSDLQKGGRSDVLSDSQRHLVIQIKEEFPAHVPQLADVRGRVETAYKQKLAEEEARKQAEELLKKSPNFAAFQTALTEMGTTYTRTRPFTRPEAQSIFGGPVVDFEEKAAGAKPGDIMLLEIGRPGMQRGFAVMQIDQVQEPSKADFARDLGNIIEQLVQKKQDILVLEYVRDQRQKLGDKIKVDSTLE